MYFPRGERGRRRMQLSIGVMAIQGTQKKEKSLSLSLSVLAVKEELNLSGGITSRASGDGDYHFSRGIARVHSVHSRSGERERGGGEGGGGGRRKAKEDIIESKVFLGRPRSHSIVLLYIQ